MFYCTTSVSKLVNGPTLCAYGVEDVKVAGLVDARLHTTFHACHRDCRCAWFGHAGYSSARGSIMLLMARDVTAVIFLFAGIVSVAVGAFMFSTPVGYIVLGTLLMFLGMLVTAAGRDLDKDDRE